jgi:hypothetical protein
LDRNRGDLTEVSPIPDQPMGSAAALYPINRIIALVSRRTDEHSAAGGRNPTSATNRAVSLPVDGVCHSDRRVLRHIRKQASLSARRRRENHGGPRRRPVWRFARCSIGLRAKRHSAFLRGPPWFSLLLRAERLACLSLGPTSRARYRRVSIGPAMRCAYRRAPALGAALAEAPACQCVIGISAKIRRGPRRVGRLVVQRSRR